MATGDIRYVITVDATGATKSIQDFDKVVEELGKTSGGTRDKARSFGSELSSKLIPSFTAASLIADGVTKTLGFLKDQFVSTFDAAMEAERIDRALNASLEITGRTVPGLAEDLSAYAAEIQRMTIYDDEAVKKAETLLVQMTDLDEEGIKKATRGAAGLASVFGMDLDSAAGLVQKAITGNTAALGRYGIKVDDTLSAEDKRLAIMAKLEKMYQRATAETDTAAGSLAQMKNTIGDAKEKIGNAFLPALSLGAKAVGDLVGKLAGLNSQLAEVDGRAKRNAATNEIYADTFFYITAKAGRTGEYVSRLAKNYEYNYESIILMIEAGKYGKELEELWNKERDKTNAKLKELKGSWTALEKGTVTGSAAAGDATKKLQETLAGLLDQADPVKARSREIFNNMILVNKAFKEGAISASNYGKIMGWLKDELRDVGKVAEKLGQTDIPAANQSMAELARQAPGIFPEIKDQLNASASGMTDVWDSAMQSMTSGLVSFGDANASVFGNVGSIFSNFAKSAIAGIEALALKEIWESNVAVAGNQAKAESGALASIFNTIPFPFSLVAAAASFALVNALFSKVLKFEQGGVFTHPVLAEVGHGTEYLLPERKLVNIVQRAVYEPAPAGRSRMAGAGGGVQYNFFIKALDGADVATVTRRKILPILKDHVEHNKGVL